MPTQELAGRASLYSHETHRDAVRRLQPREQGKGRGNGFSVRQARHKFAELVKKPSLQRTPYGQSANQLEVVTHRGQCSRTMSVHMHGCTLCDCSAK